jgi:hypothetical protein
MIERSRPGRDDHADVERRASIIRFCRYPGARGTLAGMRTMALGVMVFLGLGCSNKLSGDLAVDGNKVGLSSCRNGTVYNFRGVELTLSDGTKLRVAVTPTNEAEVYLIPAGGGKGSELGRCGTIQIEDQNSTINDVRNVEGKVTLDCTGDGATLKGSVSFENCH